MVKADKKRKAKTASGPASAELRLPACLLACLPARPSACPPACLPTTAGPHAPDSGLWPGRRSAKLLSATPRRPRRKLLVYYCWFPDGKLGADGEEGLGCRRLPQTAAGASTSRVAAHAACGIYIGHRTEPKAPPIPDKPYR